MKKHLFITLPAVLVLCLCALCALADGAPSVSVSSTTPQYNETITVTVQAPAGATAVRVWNDGGWNSDESGRQGRWEYYDQNLNWLQTRIMCWDAGSWLVRAAYTNAAYAGREELEDLTESAWTPIGQDILLTVSEMIGVMDPPDAHLVSDVVVLGEPVRVVIDSLQGKDEWYFAELERWEDGRWTPVADSRAEYEAVTDIEQIYPTVQLTSGRYRLRLACEAIGWDQAYIGDLNETTLAFTVREPSQDPPEAALYFSSDHALSFEQLAFWAWAEGADHIHITVTMEGNASWRNDMDFEGGLQRVQWSSSDSGTYCFTLTAFYGEEERTAEPFTLVQTAPYGSLSVPSILNVPSMIVLGQGVSGSLSSVPNAQDYQVTLNDKLDSGEIEEIWQDTPGSGRTFSIPGEFFSHPGVYELQAHSHALGFNGGHTRQTILVTEIPAQSLTLRVNGSTGDTAVPSMQRFSVDVDFPENVTGLRIYDGNQWAFFDAEEFRTQEMTCTPGSFAIMAQGTEDEPVWRAEGFDWSSFRAGENLNWTMRSNVVTVSVTAPNGSLAAPSITVPSEVTRGSWLQVTLGSVANAESYHLRVIYVDENGRESDCFWNEDCTVGTVLIPTASMAPGEGYIIEAQSNGVGFVSGRSEQRFTVTESAQAQSSFLVSQTQALTWERFSVSVYAPGADRLMIKRNGEFWFDRDGDSFTGTFTIRSPDTYVLQAIATRDGGESWDEVGVHTVTVAAPYGQLPVTISAPESVSPDGTAEITVTWAHNGLAYDGWFSVYDQQWNEQSDALTLLSRSEGESSTTGTYRVDGAYLTAGEVFLLEAGLSPQAEGYQETMVRRELAVLSSAAPGGTLRVEKTELLRCEGTTVTVDVPGATALLLHLEQDRWEFIPGSEASGYYQFFNEGANQVFARYTTDTITLDEEGRPVTDGISWTGVTNLVTVRVTVNDRLITPDCTLAEEFVPRGEPFIVTVNALQNKDEWYMAQLRDPDTQAPLTDTCFWDEGTRTLRIDTATVAPGLYNLNVWSDAVGCTSAGTSFFVGIEEPAEGRLYVSLPSSPVLSQETYAVSAYASNAARIELIITAPGTQIQPRSFSSDGDTLRINDLIFGNGEGVRHVVITAYKGDGSIIDSYETDITVSAPYGDRPAPRIFMPGIWTEGQDLRFRVDAGDALYIYVDIVDLTAGPDTIVYEDEDLVFDAEQWRYQLPASSFTAGHSYRIEGFTSGIGYNAQAFAYTVNLLPLNASTLSLPAFLTGVDEEAFLGAAARRVIVPQGVTAIGTRAFADCPNLLVAELPAALASLPADAFTTPVTVYTTAGSPLENAVSSCPAISLIYLSE